MHELNKAAVRVCPRDRKRWRTPAARGSKAALRTVYECVCVFQKLGGRKKHAESRAASPNIYLCAERVSVPASPIHFYALFKSWFAFYISSSIVSFYRGNSERPAQPVPQWDSPLSLALWLFARCRADAAATLMMCSFALVAIGKIPAASAAHIILCTGCVLKRIARDAINDDLSPQLDAAEFFRGNGLNSNHLWGSFA